MTRRADELRERTRQQLLASFGGWSGTVISALPLVVFVAVNAVTRLRPAIWAAVITAVLLAGYRLIRRQSVQQAATGLFSVLVAAAIAAHTGQARGFFLLGIAGSILYGAIFAITLIIRRPLVGLLWEFLDPAPLPDGVRWYRVRPCAGPTTWPPWPALAMFAARAVVQLSLFRDNRTGWLAVTKIAMGFPLYLAGAGLRLLGGPPGPAAAARPEPERDDRRRVGGSGWQRPSRQVIGPSRSRVAEPSSRARPADRSAEPRPSREPPVARLNRRAELRRRRRPAGWPAPPPASPRTAARRPAPSARPAWA